MRCTILATVLGLASLAVSAPAALVSRQASLEQVTDNYMFDISIDEFITNRNAKNPPELDWSSNGCTASPDNPFGFDFINSCYRHDFGYRNFKAQNRFEANKARIDDNFKTDMFNQCANESAKAGFYPVTVTYLSLFYTRFEFGRRLSFFYGQAAVGGALGGLISYLVFSHFGNDEEGSDKDWRPWQVLFLLEGTLTIVVAFIGYFWLPHSIETAWFLTPEERQYASARVVRDRDIQNAPAAVQEDEHETEDTYDEESRGLLDSSKHSASTITPTRQLVDDRGLSPHDILSAVFNTKIWHILACNVLSAVPVYAFSVFLPLVLAPLTEDANPALINLLTAPPHICGAIVLYFAASYSDKHRIRLKPIMLGLLIMVAGLVLVVLLPSSWAVPRYIALNILLSGTYIASPLTVAWISGNTPSPGKRALLLGINGWGNLAGVISAILFRPKYAAGGYIVPFWWTLASVALAAIGYVLFYRRLKLENETRQGILRKWSEDDVEAERVHGRGPLPQQQQWLRRAIDVTRSHSKLTSIGGWLEQAVRGREGDDRLTFVYGL
ncbi:unnamed protein product [Alternaria alternata]